MRLETVHTAAITGICAILAVSSWLIPTEAMADETCMSPYMAKITSHEDFL